MIYLVRTGKKGHFPAAMHIELLTELEKLLPVGSDVILVGDGEFDSIELQSFLADAGWGYVCRTVKNTVIATWERREEDSSGYVPLAFHTDYFRMRTLIRVIQIRTSTHVLQIDKNMVE